MAFASVLWFGLCLPLLLPLTNSLPEPARRGANPTHPPAGNSLLRELLRLRSLKGASGVDRNLGSTKQQQQQHQQQEYRRPQRSLDIVDGILKTIGLGVDLGGPQLSYNAPNISLDMPVGQIACIGGTIGKRDRRDHHRPNNAESLGSDEKGSVDVSF